MVALVTLCRSSRNVGGSHVASAIPRATSFKEATAKDNLFLAPESRKASLAPRATLHRQGKLCNMIIFQLSKDMYCPRIQLAKIVAAEAFSSSSLGPPLSTKNRFDLLSSTDERDVSMTYHVLEGFLICAFVVLNSNLSLRSAKCRLLTMAVGAMTMGLWAQNFI
ncbi:hypothetical protein HID58_013959 [Brassica napus]|uniref:Uncharacterized protein n=1 Tax=Brassica napus TaxID=3708 RepID=A0ABQ8DFW8_BRANA|nr:hypothetical protein HID58_013959 [Brassica napus]